jgi:hypothetical protein
VRRTLLDAVADRRLVWITQPVHDHAERRRFTPEPILGTKHPATVTSLIPQKLSAGGPERREKCALSARSAAAAAPSARKCSSSGRRSVSSGRAVARTCVDNSSCDAHCRCDIPLARFAQCSATPLATSFRLDLVARSFLYMARNPARTSGFSYQAARGQARSLHPPRKEWF